MGERVNELVNLLLAGVRDLQGTYHAHDLALNLLGRCEQIVNDALRLVTVETTVYLEPYQSFYSLQTHVPEGVSVLSVRYQDKDLDRLTDLSDLGHLSRSWHRQTREQPRCWLQLGETYLILWPTVTHRGETVTVVSTKLTPLYASLPFDSTAIAHTNIPSLMALTRAFLNLRARQYDAFEADLAELKGLLAVKDLDT